MPLAPGVHEGERVVPCPDCGSRRTIASVDFEGVVVWACECGSTRLADAAG